MTNAELVEEELEGSDEVLSTIRANGTELEAEGGDVRVENVAKRRCGVAPAFQEAIHFEPWAVVDA